MLRITQTSVGDEVILKLEGKLLHAWKHEVKTACARLPAAGVRKRLDLAGLTFVDSAGVDLLRGLMLAGFELTGSSGFISELLRTE